MIQKENVFFLLILHFEQWADISKMKIVIVMMNYEMRIGLPRRRPSRHQETTGVFVYKRFEFST